MACHIECRLLDDTKAMFMKLRDTYDNPQKPRDSLGVIHMVLVSRNARIHVFDV